MRKVTLLAASVLILSLLLALSLRSALAGGTVEVRLELLSSPTLHLALGEVVDSPIRVRVLRQSDSVPLEGVAVDFLNDVIFCVPLHPTCVEPDPLMYGGFLSAPDASPGTGRSMTNADGIAVSPDYRAGSVAGSYRIVAGVFSHAGQNFSSLGSTLPAVQVVQGKGGGTTPGSFAMIPTTGWQGQMLLVVLMLLLGGLLLRHSQG